jgi:hypothetical protein
VDDFERFREDIEARLEAIEEKMKPSSGVGVFYSRLQRQQEELALQLEGLMEILIQALQVLQKLPHGSDFRRLLESCNELKKKHEPDDETIL